MVGLYYSACILAGRAFAPVRVTPLYGVSLSAHDKTKMMTQHSVPLEPETRAPASPPRPISLIIS